MAAHMFIVKYPHDNTDGRTDDINDEKQNAAEGKKKNADESFFAHDKVAEILRTVLPSLGIKKQVTTTSDNKLWEQMTFICSTTQLTEKALNTLSERGIGKHFQSSLSVIPVPIHLADHSATGSQEDLHHQAEDIQKDKKVKHFVKSIRSRLIVAQVVEQVKSASNLTFDFVLLIILASMISAIGLSENSSVVLVASMLISPLMGPIMGGTFGIVIKHSPLRNTGIKTEVVGLFMCVLCGLLFGLIAYPFLGGVWPTEEMKSRGEPRSLLIGLFIALPSGAGVALSILGNNTGSLIGVAISASLLPPAVNAGMLWATSIIRACQSMVSVNTTAIPDTDIYSASELAVAGTLSLTLTLLNILCVFVMAVIVMKVKEVAPNTSTATTHQFWKNDIKVAREYYDVLGGNVHRQNIGKKLFQDFQETLKKLETQDGDEVTCMDTLKGRKAAKVARDFKTLIADLEREPSYQDIVQQLNEPQLNVSYQIPTSPSEPEWLSNLFWKSNSLTTTSQPSPYKELHRLVSQDDFVLPGTDDGDPADDNLYSSFLMLRGVTEG